MFLSIVIPVFNSEKYLKECLESCIVQDIKLNEEYEIICVNDGSTDSSLDILNEYEKKYNIKVINQKNSGVSAARNCGIECAKGEYIWFVDSDDTIKADCLNMLKTLTCKNECDILSFNGYRIYKDDDYTECLTNRDEDKVISYFGYVWTHLYKKCVLSTKSIRFDSRIKYGEDELFYVQAFREAKKAESIDEIVYYYRIHENSVMANAEKNINERIESVIISISVLRNSLDNKSCAISDFEKNFVNKRYKFLRGLLSRAMYSEYKKFIRQLTEKNLILEKDKHGVSGCLYDIPTKKDYWKEFKKRKKYIFIKKCKRFLRKFKWSNIKEHLEKFKK